MKEIFESFTAKQREKIIKESYDCGELNLSSYTPSHLSQLSQQLYESCSQSLQKLYNLENSTETRLHDGEIDDSIMHEWFTEKNIDIFKKDINLVQNRNIIVTFILDRSGSMGGSRFMSSVAMICALAHAFEDINIKLQDNDEKDINVSAPVHWSSDFNGSTKVCVG